MKLWPRLLAVCALPAVSLLFATQGQLGRVGELPLWYWAICILLAASLLYQAIWQPLNSLQGRRRGVLFGSWFGVYMFLMSLSGQALKPQPEWGGSLLTGLIAGLMMGWVYSYGGANRNRPQHGKRG
ncbi:hypothetical protein FNU79_10345 [Deinococcus detaillensis]|uniref:TIGR04086 family membrane protein n=1 Tax=Deinococcus detaillensis TaxID=2592048 RepID=A0A553UWP4_9DEIO|nr:hypothetical protein [Deinococcus detaillensis]TSA84625.1 hypothetical protein FNU79_10345 [Deinococcus detaillensis]